MVEEVVSVTAELSHKPQEAVILVAVLSGLLETGVRYVYSLLYKKCSVHHRAGEEVSRIFFYGLEEYHIPPRYQNLQKR